jgi:Fe-S-cluster containining protein
MTTSVFDCRMCGHCCQGQGGIVASAPELERLAAFLGITVGEFRDLYTQPQGKKTVLRCGEDGYCIFFDREKACTVHPAKPDVCRAWPFFRGNLADAVSWELAQDYCPGIVAESGHAEFVRQGLAYVRENGLAKEGRADEAGALRIADLADPAEGN